MPHRGPFPALGLKYGPDSFGAEVESYQNSSVFREGGQAEDNFTKASAGSKGTTERGLKAIGKQSEDSQRSERKRVRGVTVQKEKNQKGKPEKSGRKQKRECGKSQQWSEDGRQKTIREHSEESMKDARNNQKWAKNCQKAIRNPSDLKLAKLLKKVPPLTIKVAESSLPSTSTPPPKTTPDFWRIEREKKGRKLTPCSKKLTFYALASVNVGVVQNDCSREDNQAGLTDKKGRISH